ncbi:MAG: hypothetical protein KIT56_06865 [Gammaproteobacteria bacterium]|nr:hypothetical protein [Gammaproteobacteria bacterium]
MDKINELPEQDIYLFNEYIRPQLTCLIENEIISKDDLISLENPINTLKYIFLNKEIFQSIKNGLCKIKEIEVTFVNGSQNHPSLINMSF